MKSARVLLINAHTKISGFDMFNYNFRMNLRRCLHYCRHSFSHSFSGGKLRGVM